MKKINSFLSLFNKNFELPFEKKLSFVIASFTGREYKIFVFFLILMSISTIGLLWRVNEMFLVQVPKIGGGVTEGIIGTPRFINPLLAISDADRDMTAIIYSGLMRANKNGVLENDMAENFKISEDGLTYTFTLKEGLYWHDGKRITSDDILFTIKKAQDQVLRSQKRASWDGVKVEKITESKLKFILPRPYAPFLENTTIGILPKHIWENINSEQFGFSKYNVEPIGGGPYMVEGVKKDSAGIPKHYDLIPFSKFHGKGPYISKLRIKFYSNITALLEAYNNGDIENINSISPKIASQLNRKNNTIKTAPLPRVFGVFFNQNNAKIFTDKVLRNALDISIDKEKLVSDIFHGYATKINSPIPPGALGYVEYEDDTINDHSSSTDRITIAKEMLIKRGWEFDEDKKIFVKKTNGDTTELAFSISTGEIDELKEVALSLKEQWEKLGARVEVKIFDSGSLNQDVIRPRKYDALLFGEIIGRDSDLFAFWHSSQRLDPGLNIALYANIAVDKLLENTREITIQEDRLEKYAEIQKEIIEDKPATFLYSPDFIYIIAEKIKGVELNGATTPSERFLNIANWYIETENVWRFFTKN